MSNDRFKPLGGKAYGSIPHLIGSRMGPGDHHAQAGQVTICTDRARDRHDRVIVTEKLDGSCTAIAKVGDEVVALGRAGFLARTSPYHQHHVFADWVDANARRFAAMPEGTRMVGEWMLVAHGTRYSGVEPWVPFDVIDKRRWPHDGARELFEACGLRGAHVIHDGGPLEIDKALAILAIGGFHGATEDVEGAVWRVERRGEFDFIAKFVRPDKMDGKYLAGIGGNGPGDVFNLDPHAIARCAA